MRWKVLIGVFIVVLLALAVVASLADEEWLVYLPVVHKGITEPTPTEGAPGKPTKTSIPPPPTFVPATPTPTPTSTATTAPTGTAMVPTETPTATAVPPTATPRPSALFLVNYVASGFFNALWYEVLGTGIGEVITNEERVFYGRFPPGVYEWCASTVYQEEVCVEAYFGSGYTTHTFWPGFGDDPPVPTSIP